MSEEVARGVFGLQMLSGGFALFLLSLGLVWWLLCIILFFKVWGMTNNINRMKDLLEEWLDIEHPVVEDSIDKNAQSENTTSSKLR